MFLSRCSFLEDSVGGQAALLLEALAQLGDLRVLIVDQRRLLLQPRAELCWCDDLDERRHESVLAAAQLRALTVVEVLRSRHLEPRVRGVAGNRVDLAPQGGDPPG